MSTNFLKKSGLKTKLIYAITALILAVSLFIFIFFPAKQSALLKKEFLNRMGTVTEMVALGSGVGLGTDQFLVIKNVFDWAKQDSSLIYIVILDKEDNKISQYPKEMELDYASLKKLENGTIQESIARLQSAIIYNDENWGTILLGADMKTVAASAAKTRITALLISIIILILGIFVAIKISNGLSGKINFLVTFAEAIKSGDFSEQKGFDSGDEIGVLADSMNEMCRTLKQNQLQMQASIDMGEAVVREVKRVSEVFKDKGDIEFRADTTIATGSYKEMLTGFNAMMDDFVSDMLIFIEGLSKYAEGDFSFTAKELPGKKIVLTQSLNTTRSNILALIEETKKLTEAAEEGRLQTRGSADNFKGGYREIILGINKILENISKPINESVEYLENMAEGNLSEYIEADYKGDFAIIKNSVNATIQSLNKLLSQVLNVSDQVVNGSDQVSDSSQALSQGATEQAASLEEVSSSMEEMSSQTKRNADNAEAANKLAASAKQIASRGNEQMKEMLAAMTEINKSAGDISKIIKVIDEIAFQTNLLALNAAVEAARAGIHGKGFAVVAEEVRNLAQRSAQAAKETTGLIEGSVKKTNNGTAIANETAKYFAEIVTGVTKVADLVEEIAVASKEQTFGLEQISQSLGQIDKVTQSNTANAEESAAAAEELASQATDLKQMLTKFSLADDIEEPLPAAHHRQLAPAKKKTPPPEQWGGKATRMVRPEDVIRLEDDEY